RLTRSTPALCTPVHITSNPVHALRVDAGGIIVAARFMTYSSATTRMRRSEAACPEIMRTVPRRAAPTHDTSPPRAVASPFAPRPHDAREREADARADHGCRPD